MDPATLLSADFWKVVIPLAGGILAWFANEARKRSWEEYVRKEENYRELLRTFRGFYVDSADLKLREEFLFQLNLCWLYCPDAVIRSAYAFLETVRVGASSDDAVKERAAGDLVAGIRRDLLRRRVVRRTSLSASDFRHLRALPPTTAPSSMRSGATSGTER